MRAKLRKVRWHAKRRGIAVFLTDEQMAELMVLPCHYCDRPPEQLSVPASRFGASITEIWVHNGLDRKDSNGDYTADNVVPCCKRCQVSKNTKPYEAFVKLAGERPVRKTVTPVKLASSR